MRRDAQSNRTAIATRAVPVTCTLSLPPVIWALGDQALISATGFVFLLAAARCLSVADFGLFSLVWMIAQLFGMVHNALIISPQTAIYPELAEGGRGAYLHHLCLFHRWLVLLASILAIGIPFSAAWGRLIISTVVVIAFRQSAEFYRRSAYVLQDPPRAAIIDAVGYAPLLGCLLWLWAFPRPLDPCTLLLIAASTSLLGWLTGALILRPAMGSPAPAAVDRDVVGEHWSFGRWILLDSFCSYTSSQLYFFLIAGYLGLVELGAFNAARSLMGITHVFLNGIESYAGPHMRTALVRDGEPGLRTQTRNITLIGLSIMIPACGLAAIWPGYLISFAIDHRYADYGWVLRYFALFYMFIFFNRIFSLSLNAMKEPRVSTLASAVAAAITISTGPAIVAHWGLSGAAIALCINGGVLALITGIGYARVRSMLVTP